MVFAPPPSRRPDRLPPFAPAAARLRVGVDEVEGGIGEGEGGPLVVGITNTEVWNGGTSPHQPCQSDRSMDPRGRTCCQAL